MLLVACALWPRLDDEGAREALGAGLIFTTRE